tara:strand:- start:13520 stop:15856 length:2337 start_codon:yes stop_codon:yes gene_type:complete
MKKGSKEAKQHNKFVDETHDIWKKYAKHREEWAISAQEDREFRLGKQWSREQEETLKARGQAPIVVNRIHPAVETAKAMLTSRRPGFRVSPREDSDAKIAQVFNGMLSYMYDISDGETQMRQIIDDYYVTGLGMALIYHDPTMDHGKGEVCFHALDPLDVYVDPNSKDRFFDDAENIIVSKKFTKEQAINLYPMYEGAIKTATSDHAGDDDQYPVTKRAKVDGIIFPQDTDTSDLDKEYVRGYERYYKVRGEMVRVHEKFSGKEFVFMPDEMERYLNTKAYIYGNQVLTTAGQVQNAVMDQEKKRSAAQKIAEGEINKIVDKKREELEVLFTEREYELREALENGEIIPERYSLEVEGTREKLESELVNLYQQLAAQSKQLDHIESIAPTNYGELVQMGFIEVVPIQETRIKYCVVIGDKKLYERVLPIDKYPVVPFMNIHTRTPYPVSDVRMVKGLQEYINKVRSLIIAHATTSTNMKVLIPAGSVDMAEFEEKWAQPGVGIEVDFDMGQPVVAAPTPLPNELYQNEITAKSDIDHQLGLYEMMMGNTQAAPQTYKATVSLDEFGQRKMKSKMADIEGGLRRLGTLAIPMQQSLYKAEKVFRIVEPNNSMSEYVINKKLYDKKGKEISTFNDIAIGKYDVVVVTGSTLPTNRYAELEFYMEAFKTGIIDRQEVLKKTEIFDKEGVLERVDLIAQLQQQLQQAQQVIKDLTGDKQTRDRENVNLKQKVEVEKFKTKLADVETKSKAAGQIFERRLDDTLGMIEKQVRDLKSKEGTSKK